jgi:DNA adenine methylase
MSSDPLNLLGHFNSLLSAEEIRETYLRAPFGWPGGKSRSIANILPHLPYRDAYIEPFGGSGVILLNRNSCKLEVFNDRFSGVTVFYRCIRDKAKCAQLCERLDLCLHSREEFIWSLKTWKNCEDEVERAARWFYSVVISFGQQARNFGRAVRGKTQHGNKLAAVLETFPELHARLRLVQIENLDWRLCLKDFDHEGAVFYIDPPYYDYNKGQYEFEMTKDEHHELIARIFELKGFVALSGYHNELYDRSQWNWDNRYSWRVHSSQLSMARQETNNLIGLERSRDKAEEILWIKESD